MENPSKWRSTIAVLSMALPVVGFGLVLLLARWVAALPKGLTGHPICIDEVGLPIICSVLLAVWVAAVGLVVVGLCVRRLGCSQAVVIVFLVVLGLMGQEFVLLQPCCDSPSTTCLVNVKKLAVANLMYAEDWDNHLPPARRWPVVVEEICREHFDSAACLICPLDARSKRQASGGIETSYTMNELCGSCPLTRFERPTETVLMFDGTALYGGHDDAAFRHNDGLNVNFADGHGGWRDRTWFQELRWEP